MPSPDSPSQRLAAHRPEYLQQAGVEGGGHEDKGDSLSSQLTE